LKKTEEIEEKYIQEGQEVWVQTVKTPVKDEKGDIRGVLGIFWDITERKRTEEALRESELRYRTLMEQIPAITYIADLDEASTTQFVSPQIEEMLGFKPDEWKDGHDVWFHQLYPDDRERVLAEVAASHASGDPFMSEYRMISRDGAVIWMRDEAIIVRDEYGNPIHLHGVMFDITERKRIEEKLKQYSERLKEMVEERTKELQDAQEQLVRREKLAVLGQLAGGLGHELRNPLGAIKNAVYLLNMILEEPEAEVKESLEIIEKEVGISERVISSLLDFARPKPSTRVKVDINEIVQATLSHVPVPENVEVVSRLDKTLPTTILGDPDQLTQAFGNLILNAIQAMPEGGRLVVKSDVTGPNQVTMTFADTGVGIPQEKMKKIFEPLFTTKAKGIGLGLALAKLLIEAHGGTIEVKSEVDKGTTFTVSLPVGGENQE
jgi:PAS domain S-box-containing protein